MMAQTMNEDQLGTVIAQITEIAAAKLSEATSIAKTASVLGAEGLADRAFEALLDAEPLLHETLALLNASSVMKQFGRGDRLS